MSPEPTYPPVIPDELGSHVSIAGGVERAPGRARELACRNLQIFTKQPNRWYEPQLDPATVAAFRAARTGHGIRRLAAHDSYLINLASPDPALYERSCDSFTAELRRSVALGIELLVTHPGNATDGDRDAGRRRNAAAVGRALATVPGDTRVLFELTAGGGTTVGGCFEDLAALLEGIPPPLQPRLGICFDTCHAWVAGYDLVDDWDGVWERFEDALGLSRLQLVHCNDARGGLGSRRDRHEHLGEGALGSEPFRRLMQETRFAAIPKLIETPKGQDPIADDRRNLAFLRAFRTAP